MALVPFNTNPKGICRTSRPRYLFACPVLAALLWGCSTAAQVELTDELFEHYQIITGTAKRQTVVSGFFRGGDTADLAVIQVRDNDQRRLQMYSFDGQSWLSVHETRLSPELLFVDVARIAGRDRLISYANGRLSWFDPDSMEEITLVSVNVSYSGSRADEIPLIDISRDLNHDHRDDLVLPDLDGFWVFIQSETGSFGSPVKIGPPEPFLDRTAFDDKRSYRQVGITTMTLPWYLSRVHQFDHDRDGRDDLVFWNKDHFDVYHQDPKGSFAADPVIFTTEVAFDSDGNYSLIFSFGDASQFSLLTGFRKKTRRSILHSFRDINDDQLADLVIHTMEGRSLLRQRSGFEIHFGKSTAQGTRFEREPGAVIRQQGRPQAIGYSIPWFQDFDGDGQIDIMLQNVNTGIGKMVRALLGNSITMDLEYYRSENRTFPGGPTTTRKIRSDLAPGPLGICFPTILMGDVNGDGRSDLLMGKNRQELQVFLGTSDAGLLARKHLKVSVALPDDKRHAWLVDLNKDGKLDLITHRASKTDPQRINVLIAH